MKNTVSFHLYMVTVHRNRKWNSGFQGLGEGYCLMGYNNNELLFSG